MSWVCQLTFLKSFIKSVVSHLDQLLATKITYIKGWFVRSCVDCKYNYNLRWILALLPIQKTYDWFYKRIKSSLPVDDLIQFLRQVHLTDSLSDPSIVPQTYTKAHWRMSVVSSASALLECSRTCSACSTGTLGLPEPSELQRDRKKKYKYI